MKQMSPFQGAKSGAIVSLCGIVIAAAALAAGQAMVALAVLAVAGLAAALSLTLILKAGRVLDDVRRVCQDVAVGRFESRILDVAGGDLGALQLAINDMIDRCDAFVREAGAAMEAVCHDKYYRTILPEGLHSALLQSAQTINAAMGAIRDKVTTFNNVAIRFDRGVNEIIGELAGASGKMNETAQSLTSGVATTRSLAVSVAAASEEASVNMQAIAGAASELTRFSSGRVMLVKRPVFRPEVIAGVDAFKLSSLRVSPTYVSQRVVEQVRSSGLRGLTFRRVWPD